MSMFLGPIHHWLYNKIRLGSERSLAVEDAFKDAFRGEADSLLEKVDNEYPAFPAGLPLEDIIGDSPIHGFLQGLIRMVETREGALMKAFVEKFGERAKETAINAASEEGERVGAAAQDEIEGDNLESLYRALYDRQLDGMPCDQGAQPEFQGEKLLVRQSECLHRDNWKEAGAPLDLMCDMTGAWIGGFLKGAAPNLSCQIEGSIIGGAGECRYIINKNGYCVSSA